MATVPLQHTLVRFPLLEDSQEHHSCWVLMGCSLMLRCCSCLAWQCWWPSALAFSFIASKP